MLFESSAELPVGIRYEYGQIPERINESEVDVFLFNETDETIEIPRSSVLGNLEHVSIATADVSVTPEKKIASGDIDDFS